jgi:hypothetical protein
MSRRQGLRIRALLEACSAVAAALLAVITLVEPDWIEQLVPIDPDQGSGALEWLVVAALVLIALLAASGARRDWRRFGKLAGHAEGPGA